MRSVRRVLLASSCAGFLVSCSGSPAATKIDYPKPASHLTDAQAAASWSAAQGVLEARCVVCHACYDAPCQLKLGTYEGIERGGTEEKVYGAERLLEAPPSRLEIDAHDVASWRRQGFHPVLPEGTQSDPHASLLVRMLVLKRDHPLPAPADIAKEFTLDLDRKQSCSTTEDFKSFAKEHPLWGMPYALPGLDAREEAALLEWVNLGAPHAEPKPLSRETQASIDSWETFLNAAPLKNQLAARYIYEHLFLASLHFNDLDDRTFFRVVRSRTPSGTAIDEIATRRPFDDPKTARVYYRFARRVESPVDKTHMPYPLSPARLKRFTDLFIGAPYVVEKLPGYSSEMAANPFRAFAAIPAQSRYRFMLEESEFTIMGFIKGPVCRGQVALNVIEDRFWITFLNPDVPWMDEETAFLAGIKQDLDMPAEAGSSLLPIWLGYAKDHPKYIKKKTDFLERMTQDGRGVKLDLLWDGDGTNPNAALTVFRHFDSATVVQGLIGDEPKTSWVVDYPLLERIHYLLVAGFDVYGTVNHQVTTRLYMDFLRLEGEANFLMFLPTTRRTELASLWYRGVKGAPKEVITRELTGFDGEPNIKYRKKAAETELYPLIKARLAPILAHGRDLSRVEDPSLRAGLERLQGLKGRAAASMPELSFVTVSFADGTAAHFTILRDSAHTNVAHLLNEDDRRLETEDQLAIVRGLLGSYPHALFDVPKKDFGAFVDEVSALDGEAGYHALRARFGILRASDRFWKHSDRIHADHIAQSPIQAGRFDYNRLEPF